MWKMTILTQNDTEPQSPHYADIPKNRIFQLLDTEGTKNRIYDFDNKVQVLSEW